MKKKFTFLFLLIFSCLAFSATNAAAQSNWSVDEKETIEQKNRESIGSNLYR